MFQPSAEIIADSVNSSGDRLTTFVLTYHRYIHSEVMTYRNLSRSAASSRAIPVEKMIKRVVEQEVYPLHWGANQKGMVANNEVDCQTQIDAKIIWSNARVQAVKHAQMLVDIGIHKQVVNRLLEPFATITVIATGTSWGNLFEQRCHPDAQPEFKALADLMRDAYTTSEPKFIAPDHPIPYHLPLIQMDDWWAWHENELTTEQLIKVSVGRCARVSYLNHDGVRSIADDIKLHDRLLASKPAHLSPFEHVAIALPNSDKKANFQGWQSYRNILENANKSS